MAFLRSYFTSIVFLVSTFLLLIECQSNVYTTNTVLYGYNATGSSFTVTNNSTLLYCNPNANWTVIIHGWIENMNAPYVQLLINGFLQNRGGCVFFFDYSCFSQNLDYLALVSNFNGLSAAVTAKLQFLQTLGFNPAMAFMWGFSFGSHLAFQSAYTLGPGLIGRIDACDPAGIGFTSSSPSVMNAKNSAKRVTCTHTSVVVGTADRYCQQDIVVDICGLSQATVINLGGSHTLCPYLYYNSFTQQIPITPRPLACPCGATDVDIRNLPPLYLGYPFNVNSPNGTYYSTSSFVNPPSLIYNAWYDIALASALANGPPSACYPVTLG